MFLIKMCVQQLVLIIYVVNDSLLFKVNIPLKSFVLQGGRQRERVNLSSSLLLTLSSPSPARSQTHPAERRWTSCASLRAEQSLVSLLFASRDLLWSPRSMGLQTWPPSKPPLPSMACLDVETPSICRGKFKSGAFYFNGFILNSLQIYTNISLY